MRCSVELVSTSSSLCGVVLLWWTPQEMLLSRETEKRAERIRNAFLRRLLRRALVYMKLFVLDLARGATVRGKGEEDGTDPTCVPPWNSLRRALFQSR